MKHLLRVMLLIGSITFSQSCRENTLIENFSKAEARIGLSSSAQIKFFEDTTLKNDYEVKNGMLCFKNFSIFLKLDTTLRRMDARSRTDFIAKLGLHSLLDKKIVLARQLENAQTKEEYEQILRDNGTPFTRQNDKLVCVYNENSAFMLNENGMLSIGGVIHCLTKDKTIAGKSVSDVLLTLRTGRSASTTTKVFENQSLSSTMRSAPGARPSANACTGFNDNTRENGDGKRRVSIEEYINRDSYYTSPGYVSIVFHNNVTGIAQKRNFWGEWVLYETDNHLTGYWYWSLEVYNRNGNITYFQAQEQPVTQQVDTYGVSATVDAYMCTVSSVSEVDVQNGNFYYYANLRAYLGSDNRPVGKYYTTGVPFSPSNACYLACGPDSYR